MQAKRLQKEIAQLIKSPPDGCVCYPTGESMGELEAKLQPMCDPYDKGLFRVHISCGERYPHEPPNVRFVTPVYHPNIDSEGRICLNLLKMPPKGCWAPSYNIHAILAGLQILLSQPNPDDPLMADITEEYRSDYARFLRKAREQTLKYAVDDTNIEIEANAAESVAQETDSGQNKANTDLVEKEEAKESERGFEGVPTIDFKSCIYKRMKL